jgi:hypothetical protein
MPVMEQTTFPGARNVLLASVGKYFWCTKVRNNPQPLFCPIVQEERMMAMEHKIKKLK